MASRIAVVLAVILHTVLLCEAGVWDPVVNILSEAIQDQAFPGCVALVGNKQGPLFAHALGHFTYGVPPPNNKENPPMSIGTLFDMASCTKVLATTTAVAQFYQRGQLRLDASVTEYLPDFGANGKEDVTVLNLLLHNSGLPPDPTPGYYSPEFGCPATKEPHPPLAFSCQQQIFKAQMAQKLEWGIGQQYNYSDMNYMTLMHIVGTLAKLHNYVTPADCVPGCLQGGVGESQCYYEAYVRIFVLKAAGTKLSTFVPNKILYSMIAPTANDTAYRHGVSQGVVDDSNAYAHGGISGHAGLFSSAPEVYEIMHRIMFAGDSDTFINRTTVDLFTKEYNHSQSSRAIGWNTNDPNVYDMGWNQSCGSLSPRTYMHTGWTGTMICADPEREVIVILLTNRVYPTYDNWKILRVRQVFSNAVQKILDAHYNTPTITKQHNSANIQ